MKKSKERVKRFLSTVIPAGEKDDLLITLFLSKRKIKSTVLSQAALDSSKKERITYEQFESWYNSAMPPVGDVVKNQNTGVTGLVTCEKWNSVTVGFTLDSKNPFENRSWREDECSPASEKEIQDLQSALATAGYDWCQINNEFIRREIPRAACYVRLMVLGKQKGIGIFKNIKPDNTLEMYCVKMDDEAIRLDDSLNLGNADLFSFAGTYDEHRAVIQKALAEHDLIWNSRCRRIQKNHARAKKGKSYYWISSYLEIKCSMETDSASDKRRFKRGNYFLNWDVALRVRDKITNVCKEEMLAEDNQ